MTESRKDHLHRRLSSYWKLELANAALVPAFMIGWCLIENQPIGFGLAIACVPMCGLLILGGLYWRAKLHQLEGRSDTLAGLLPFAHKWRLPLLATTALACALAMGVWVSPGLATSVGERWAITVAAALAALEYVNYYHRQLQHFDNWPDFRRLVTGRGFRRSWMARDLERAGRETKAGKGR